MPTVRFQLRRDPAASWASVNPTLNNGEPAIETDTRKIKFGDGTSPWNMLPYFTSGGVTSVGFSGGSTGLTATGGPITDSGTFTLSGTLDETAGGTGFSSYIAGDMIYAVNGTALARLGIGPAGSVLTSNGSLPSWTPSTGTDDAVRKTRPQFTNAIGVGAAAATSGAGVSFPASQSPSSDPNTLDDYEEGSFIPVVTATAGAIATMGAVSGKYTKVGRMVSFEADISIADNGTGAGAIRISNLPFIVDSSPYCGFGTDIGLAFQLLQMRIYGTSSIADITAYNGSYPGGSGARLVLSGTYFV